MPRGRAPGVSLERFNKLIDDYLDSAKFNSFRDATRKWMRYVLGLAARSFGHVPTPMVNVPCVQAFLDGLSHVPGVQYQARKALRMLEKWALRYGRLSRPITYGTEIIGIQGAREPWSELEVALAVEHVGPNMAKAIQLISWTGQRLGDIARMRWDHLRLVKGRLGIEIARQEKTGRAVWAPILPEFEPVFSSWPRTSLTILTNSIGGPWTQSTLSTQWWRARSGNPMLAPLQARRLSLHGLRATAVIRLRLDGLSNARIGAIVGMSEPIVNVYCRRADRDADAIAGLEQRERNATVIAFKTPSK
jgi:integrase